MKAARSSTARRWPSLRLSKTTTSWPSSSRSSTQMLPIYPAPPTTKIFIRGSCGVARSCQKKLSSELAKIRPFALLRERKDHSLDAAIFLSGGQHFKALLLRTPFNDVDIDRADAPTLHLQPVGSVEIDCPCTDQGAAVIIDLKNFVRIYDSKFGSEGPARPIGSCAPDILARESTSDCIAPAAPLGVGVGGGAYLANSLCSWLGNCNLRSSGAT